MRQHAADDRQRVVHLLARARVSVEAESHLGVSDVAGLVSGTLLKTECARVENHLLVCERCQEITRSLHDEYEAGVVPILFRRAPPRGPARPSLRERLTRRYSPLIVAAGVAVIVAIVPVVRSLLTRGQQGVEDSALVVSRVGTPVIRGRRGKEPADTGAWMDGGDVLVFETGDWVEVLQSDGSIVRRSLESPGGGKDDPVGAPSPLLAQIFKWAKGARAEATPGSVAENDPSTRRLGIVHPRGRIFSRRPVLRWSDVGEGEEYTVTVSQKTPFVTQLFKVEAQGRFAAFPAEEVSLRPGQSFLVELSAKGSAFARQSFEVVGPPDRDAIAAELRQLDRLLGREPCVIRAEYMRNKGLLGEAREELEKLRISDGGNLHLLELLRRVYHRLGLRRDEARALKLIRKRRGE